MFGFVVGGLWSIGGRAWKDFDGSGDLSVSAVLLNLSLYASTLRCMSRGRNVGPLRKHEVAWCPLRPQQSQMMVE